MKGNSFECCIFRVKIRLYPVRYEGVKETVDLTSHEQADLIKK